MPTVHTMIEKLCKLLKMRFDAELSYKKLTQADHSLYTKLLKESPIQQNGKWFFAVYREYQLVGCAIVTGLKKPLNTMPEQLAEFVELYLDAAVALTDRIEVLDQIEQQMRGLHTIENNVIPLRKQAANEGLPLLLQRLRPLAFAMPCLLEGSNDIDLKQFALELHDLSGRYAFIHLSDLIWSHADDLKNIGPVTLYIPNLATLSLSQQNALVEYLRARPDREQAQVVGAIQTGYYELRQSGLVLLELMHLMSVCYIKMDRPFREYRREGIMEFILGQQLHEPLRDSLI